MFAAWKLDKRNFLYNCD